MPPNGPACREWYDPSCHMLPTHRWASKLSNTMPPWSWHHLLSLLVVLCCHRIWISWSGPHLHLQQWAAASSPCSRSSTTHALWQQSIMCSDPFSIAPSWRLIPFSLPCTRIVFPPYGLIVYSCQVISFHFISMSTDFMQINSDWLLGWNLLSLLTWFMFPWQVPHL